MKDAIKPYSMILSKQSDTAKNQFALNKNVNISTAVYMYLSIFSQERCKVQTFAKKMNSQVSWMPKLQPNTFLIQRIFIVSFIFLYAD